MVGSKGCLRPPGRQMFMIHETRGENVVLWLAAAARALQGCKALPRPLSAPDKQHPISNDICR